MTEERSNIYIDVEDDITAIIGKVSDAAAKQVRLVVPKRSTVLQSVVNLKLIKKGAQAANKEAVLVTEDLGVTKLAARLGILTAPNLKAEPSVPKVEQSSPLHLPSDTIEGEAVDTGSGAPSEPKPPAKAAAAVAGAKAAKDGLKKRIPDFNVFKKKFVLIMLGLAGLIFLGWAALIWLPKAKILVSGRTEPLAAEFSFTADTEAERADFDNDVLPANGHELSKTLAKSFNATGKKDAGTKASGTLSIKNCEDTNARSLSAGSRFTSSSGRVFLSDSGVTVPAGSFSGGGTVCNSASAQVGVTAEANGDSYNIGPTSYTTNSLSGNFIISGSQMSGGTSKTITVVTQGDIDAAKTELLNNEKPNSQKELANQFDSDEYIIPSSLAENIEQIASNPGVDQEANAAQLTLKVKYTQLAVKQAELKELMVRNEKDLAKKESNTSSLGVVNEGLDKVEIAVVDKPAATATRFNVKTQALLGPDINFDELKERVGGKNFSQTVEIVKSYPHVSGADVKFSPFWVRKVPRNPEKVTIEVTIPQPQ